MDGLDRASEADDRKDESGNFTARGSERRSSGRPPRLQDRLAPTIRSVEVADAIAGAEPAIPGVPQKLRAYSAHASVRFVAARSARSRRTAMHPTASFPAHRRRHTRLARARFGPAAGAGKHRAGITRMVGRHPFLSPSPRKRYRLRFANDVARSLRRPVRALSAHASSTPFPAQADYRSRQSSGCHC